LLVILSMRAHEGYAVFRLRFRQDADLLQHDRRLTWPTPNLIEWRLPFLPELVRASCERSGPLNVFR